MLFENENDCGYGNKNQTPEEKQKEFESLGLKSDIVLKLFNNDLEGEKNQKIYYLFYQQEKPLILKQELHMD